MMQLIQAGIVHFPHLCVAVFGNHSIIGLDKWLVFLKAGAILSTPIVRSRTMTEIYSLAKKMSQSDISVLITGETGSGKEVLASYIHENSTRSRRGKLVKLNCAAIHESLMESELFGHTKGAFTGAYGDKAGLIEEANDGTLFLDEVSEMNLSMQKKLLRTLDSGEYFPVGSSRPRSSDFRLICATNGVLEDMMKSGTFREDLYYRISAATFEIPPLRERIEEIPALVARFVSTSAKRPIRISPEVMEVLSCYLWPGNIRELKSAVEYGIATMEPQEAELDLTHMPERVLGWCDRRPTRSGTGLKNRRRCFERNLVLSELRACNDDYNAVSQRLSISVSQLYRIIRNQPTECYQVGMKEDNG